MINAISAADIAVIISSKVQSLPGYQALEVFLEATEWPKASPLFIKQ